MTSYPLSVIFFLAKSKATLISLSISSNPKLEGIINFGFLFVIFLV